jgi:2-isopropylmalate synthase
LRGGSLLAIGEEVQAMSEEKSRRPVIIFDTTLRDGEQSPGVSLTVAEKLEIARQLARLRVDVIEAGFPITSPGDFAAVKAIAAEVKGPVICALARAARADIERAWEAVAEAEKPRIHTFIATSPIHMKYKLRKTPAEVLKAAVAAVELAKSFTPDVEFSAEDATRSDPEFLVEIFSAVIAAGATTINVPDTVGYTTPEEFFRLITFLREKVAGADKVTFSVHCHNDLGLAVANSLAAVAAGADQVECTINGIGERAGNASLEEVVMALKTRADQYGRTSSVYTPEISRTSLLVERLTGMPVQPNKAVVGANAFAHESGIHQDGVLKERTTYEIMRPEDIGLASNRLVLGKHSGRHAFRERLAALGYNLSDEELERAFTRFKEVADRKKEITERDLEAIVQAELPVEAGELALESFQVTSGNQTVPMAQVSVIFRGERRTEAATGNGPVHAVYQALNRAVGISPELREYSLKAVTAGGDALGEATVRLEWEGESYTGRGLAPDVVEASARAYAAALNKLLAASKTGSEKKATLAEGAR